MAYPDGTVPTDQTGPPDPDLRDAGDGARRPACSGGCATASRTGILFALYLLLAGTERFLVEFIRRNDDVALGLTQAQLISVAMMIAGGVWLAGRPSRRGARAGAGHGAEPIELDRAEQAAVERDHRSREIGGPLRAQERDQVAVLLRLARVARPGPAARRRSSAPSSEPSGSASRSVANMPGGDRVDRDAVGRHLVGEGLEQADRRQPVARSRAPGRGSARGSSVEETLTIRPQPRSRIPGTTPSTRTRGARTSERKASSHSSSELSSAPPGGGPPVLATRISIGPERLGDLAGQLPQPVQVAGVGRRRRAPRRRSRRRRPAASPRERLEIATRAPSRASAPAIPLPDALAGAHHQRGPALDP